jgi:hypothetical protein
VALVGTFALARGADAGPTTTFVIATRAIAPGDPIDTSSLGMLAVDLPDQQAARAFAATSELRDAVALTAIEPGEIVQRSAVRDTASDGGTTAQITLSLDRACALGGRLQTGERVTVLATYGTGESASTLVLARAATVVSTESNKNGVGSSGAVLVTLGLPDADAVVAVAHAAEVGTVTLARTGAVPADADVGTEATANGDVTRYTTPNGSSSGTAVGRTTPTPPPTIAPPPTTPAEPAPPPAEGATP